MPVKPPIGVGKTIFRIGLVVFGLILVLVLTGRFFTIVPAGSVGVVETFGKVHDEELLPGFHVKSFFSNVTMITTRTQDYTMSIVPTEGTLYGDDSIRVLTKEGLSVDLDITVLYSVDEGKAAELYQNVGLQYSEIIVRPEIRSTIREVSSQYEAKAMYSDKRVEVRDLLLSELQEKLTSRWINIEEVLLRNVNLPETLAAEIEATLTSKQESETYTYKLLVEEKEAERKAIEAAGQAKAQELLNTSLTSEYLQYKYIETVGQCSGTIYVPVDPETGLPMIKTVD